MSTTKPNSYLYFLDGLRAVAIIAVLMFHSDNTWLSGGFLGVEIFFVISGFIITKLLLDEWHQTGSVDLKRFWLRRLRRLIPAAFTVMLATWISVLLWFPDEINQIFDDLLYGITFANNWNYIINERSYFELVGRPRLLEHLWSLGVEFQFYLIWALLCVGLFRLSRVFSVGLIAVFALASTCWMAYLYNPNVDPSRVYFGTDTRASALFIGSIVALLVRESESSLSLLKCHFVSFVAVASSISLASFCFYVKSSDVFLFQGGFLIVSILTAIVISACLYLSKQNYFSVVLWILSTPFLRFIGIRAYGIYLWHWAIFSLTQPFVDVPFDGLILLLFRLFLTLVLSEMTFQFVEKPIRNGCIERIFYQQKSVALWLFAGSLSLAGCSGLMIATEQKLETTPQYEINAAVNEAVEAKLSKNALDVPLIERSDAKTLCDVNENTPMISPEKKLFLVSDQTTMQMKPVNFHEHKKLHHDEAKTETPNRLQFEHSKQGYINRVMTIEKAGEKSPIFLLGDSVMVGATEELVKRFPTASLDFQVGRQLSKGIQILAERKNNHTLSDIVIIHLGNNSPINPHQIDELVTLLGNTKKIILVNLKLPRNYEAANNQLLAEAANQHSNIRVVDWRGGSMNAKNVFGKDGIHLVGNGAKLYADLITAALK